MDKKRWLVYVYFVFTAGLTVALTACGGGGGGGGGVTPPATSYTGITSQAQIDGDNATVLAAGTWVTGDLGTKVDIFGAVQTEPGFQNDPYSLVAIPAAFEGAINQIQFTSFKTSSYLGAVQELTLDPIYGSCGGVVTGSGTGDDATGAITASLIFENYCDGGVIINGPANLSGTINPDTGELMKFTMSFSSLALGDSLTLKGSFGGDYTSLPVLITMSYVVLYNQTMKTYWFRDVQLQLTGAENYVDITAMTGRYYDHDIGYVEISIDEPIRINDFESWPASGSFILRGSGGTKARLSFLNGSEYLVEADTDGDGVYDYTDGPLSWTDETVLESPFIFSENAVFAGLSAGYTDYYAMKTQVKSNLSDQAIYIQYDETTEQIPFSPFLNLLSGPYFTYMKRFGPIPPYAPPGIAWEGRDYVYFLDSNGNGSLDQEETSMSCSVPPGAFRQMDIPVVTVTGGISPTISWQPVAGAASYVINFFAITAENTLGSLVFTVKINADGSPANSYVYNGDLFSTYPVLAVMVIAKDDDASCYYNRSLSVTTHGL